MASRRRRLWHRPSLRVELLFLEGSRKFQKTLKGRNWFKGSGTARLHFSGWGASGDTVVVVLCAPPETTFKVRWSADTTMSYEEHQGYPSLPQVSKMPPVDACRIPVNG